MKQLYCILIFSIALTPTGFQNVQGQNYPLSTTYYTYYKKVSMFLFLNPDSTYKISFEYTIKDSTVGYSDSGEWQLSGSNIILHSKRKDKSPSTNYFVDDRLTIEIKDMGTNKLNLYFIATGNIAFPKNAKGKLKNYL